MSISQRVFLHPQIMNLEDVEKCIDGKKRENDQLDYKGTHWKASTKKTSDGLKEPSLETAKDIAAMANNLGGDIILGIKEDNDRQPDWLPIPTKEVSEIIDEIKRWMMKHLRPQEFAGLVEIKSFDRPDSERSVIVVSIPPARQLIAVEDQKSDHLLYKFPVRIGTDTRFLTLDEAMNRSLATKRSMYIRLKELEAGFLGKEIKVAFNSPVTHRFGIQEDAPVETEDQTYGSLTKITEDSVIIRMRPAFGVSIRIKDKFVVPIEFIRAAWTDHFPEDENKLFLRLALDATIKWRTDGGHTDWVLVADGSRRL